jgi:hypothetical protein
VEVVEEVVEEDEEQDEEQEVEQDEGVEEGDFVVISGFNLSSLSIIHCKALQMMLKDLP